MKKGVLKRLIGYSKKETLFLVFGFVFALVSVAATLFIPIIVGKAMDYMPKANAVDFPRIMNLIYILIALVSLGALANYAMNYVINTVIYRLVNNLRKESFARLSNLPISYIDGHIHGDILSKITLDIDQISDGMIQAFTQFFSGILTICFTLGFMLVISWSIALVVVVLTPLSLICASMIAKMSYKVFKEQSMIKGEMSGLMNEMLENQHLIVAYDYQDNSINRFKEVNLKLHKCGVKAQFLSSLVNPTTRFINALVYASVGIFGALLAIKGSISVGTLFVFLSYASSYTKPFNEISGVVAELQNSFASARRVFALIDEEGLVEDLNAIELQASGNFKIDKVSFSYQEDEPLIQDFNLDVTKGQMVAIVGPTGCGKTTMINLLMRFYDVKGGAIYLDGININTIKRNSLRGNIGMVLQDTWLFQGTIYENIAYAKVSATREEVIEASKQSYAHNFIMRMPNGYDTTISDAAGLSTGEKQLLCIARLMLKSPNILILDEATSNIDTRTEILVQKAFAKLMKGRTTFIIAHRLQTIKEADVILVMKNGNVVESGTHKTLLKRKQFYSELYYAQFVGDTKNIE